MALADTLLRAGGEMRRLSSSLASFQHAAGNVSATMAAAAESPSIFRRDTQADIVALASEQNITGIRAHLFHATGPQAEALGREQTATAEQMRPFLRNDPVQAEFFRREQEATAQQMRPFLRNSAIEAETLRREQETTAQQQRPFRR